MSITIAIVIPPVSSIDQVAWEQLRETIHAEGEPAKSLQKLIVELTKKYPCICDLPDNEIDDGVWSDGPLMRNAGSRAAVIGVVHSRAYEVLPFVIETAGRMGLIVFDFQDGTIHRPTHS